jgi:MFS family permease
VIGSLAYLAVRTRSAVGLIATSTAAIGFAYLGMARADTLAVACAFSILGGVGNGVQWIVVVTALQEATPRDYQARVTGLLESLGAAMPGLGYLLGGLLATLGSPRTAYGVAGVGLLVLVVCALAARTRLDPTRHTLRPSDIPLPDPLSPAARFEGGNAHER